MHDFWKIVLILAVSGWLADAHRISTKLTNETDTFDGDQLIFAHVVSEIQFFPPYLFSISMLTDFNVSNLFFFSSFADFSSW